MKRLTLLVACVLLVLFLMIRELVCSSGLDLRTGKDGPGNRPVIESESGRVNELNSEGGHTEEALQENALDKVLICKSKRAYAYHARHCQGLKRCKAARDTLTKKEAVEAGYKACKYCY